MRVPVWNGNQNGNVMRLTYFNYGGLNSRDVDFLGDISSCSGDGAC
jgi:hypothetical protein